MNINKNQEILKCLNLYRNFLLNLNLSSNTIKAYCLDVDEFIHIGEIDFLSEVEESKVAKWSLEIKKKATDNKTVNRKIAAVKKFMQYLADYHDVNVACDKYFKNLKIKEKILRMPTVEDIFDILNYIKNYRNDNRFKLSANLNNLAFDNFKDYKLEEDIKLLQKTEKWEDFRNYLMVKMLFTFGLRVGELCELKMSDFVMSFSSFSEINSFVFKKQFTVMGKGSKERVLPILDFISLEIQEMICLYPKSIFNPREGGFLSQNLFLNRQGKKVTPFYIERFLRNVKQELGIIFDINPHIFRHACATYLLESGANIREIQVLLGHSSLDTTQKYTKISKKSLMTGLNKIEF